MSIIGVIYMKSSQGLEKATQRLKKVTTKLSVPVEIKRLHLVTALLVVVLLGVFGIIYSHMDRPSYKATQVLYMVESRIGWSNDGSWSTEYVGQGKWVLCYTFQSGHDMAVWNFDEQTGRLTAGKTPPASTLSFEAVNWELGEGVSIKCPKQWWLDSGQRTLSTLPYVRLWASVSGPVLIVSKVDGATITDAFSAAMASVGAAEERLLSKKQVTLADGTPATEAKFTLTSASNQTWQAQGMPPDAMAVGVEKGDSWIIAVLLTGDAEAGTFDEAKFAEILYTLRVEK
jgi:hypothetical protein